MSVRINLLPQEAAERQAASRQRAVMALGAVVLLAGLGGTTYWQEGRIAEAEDRLADEQAVLASLQREVAQLGEFAELDTALTRSRDLVSQALGDEVSIAAILQDVSAVMPGDAELESLTLSLDDQAAGTSGTPSLGTIVASGRSASDHAPGVERLLLNFDAITTFRDVFVTNTVLDDPDTGHPSFTFEAQIGPEVATGRYLDGFPEELR